MRGVLKGNQLPKFFAPAILVVLLVVVAGVVLILERGSPTPTQQSTSGSSSAVTTGSTSQSEPPVPVRTAVDQLFSAFNRRDVDGIMKFYAVTADVIWTGNTEGLQGGYAGAGNIQILYGSTIGKTSELNATISSYQEHSLSPSNVNVTLTLHLSGNSSILGTLDGVVGVTQKWIFTGGQWEIVKENWEYRTFLVQYPASATTFPQWGLLRSGKNPDLVSEKSIEWKAGPLLALIVYVALVGVACLAAVGNRFKWHHAKRTG